MKKREFLEKIKIKFCGNKTHYQILQISPSNVTDETVRKSYENKIKELKALFADNNDKETTEVKEIIERALTNAYTALKTENSRQEYNNFLKNVKEKDER